MTPRFPLPKPQSHCLATSKSKSKSKLASYIGLGSLEAEADLVLTQHLCCASRCSMRCAWGIALNFHNSPRKRVPILQRMKLRHTDARHFVQGHTGDEGQAGDPNPGSWALRAE